MPISAMCPGCGTKLNAPDSVAGKTVKCPKCAKLMKMPEAADDGFEVVDDEPPAPKPKKRPPIDDDEPPRKSAKRPVLDDDEEDDRSRRRRRDDDDDDEDYDDRPRKKKKKKKKAAADNGPMIRNIIGGVVLLIVLVGGGILLYNKFSKSDSEDKKSEKAADGKGGQTRVNGSSSASDKADALMRMTNEMVQSAEQMLGLLDSMNDEASAQQAIAAINDLNNKMRENIAEIKKIGSIPASEYDRMNAQMPNFAKLNIGSFQSKAAAAGQRLASANVSQTTIQSLISALTTFGQSFKDFSAAVATIRNVR